MRSIRQYAPIPPELDKAAREIIGAAIEVHRHLGPGMRETIYERAMMHELQMRGLTFQQQVPIVLKYKDIEIHGQRADLVVDPGVLVELKAIEQLMKIHERQIVSYLKSTGYRLGLLINFNVMILKEGIRRVVN